MKTRSVALCALVLSALGVLGCKRSDPPEKSTDPAETAPATPPPAPEPAPPPRPWYTGTWRAEVDLRGGAPQTGPGLPREWREQEDTSQRAVLDVHVDEAGNAKGTLTGGGLPELVLRGAFDGVTLRATLEPPQDLPPEKVEPGDFELRGTLVASPQKDSSPNSDPTPEGDPKFPADGAPEAPSAPGTPPAPGTRPAPGTPPSPEIAPGTQPAPETAPPPAAASATPPTGPLRGTLRLSSGDSLLVRRAEVSLVRTAEDPTPARR